MRKPEAVLQALNDLGASQLSHINGDLEAHLLGTYQRLHHWGGSEVLCMAGLFHAVYGTYGFGDRLVDLSARKKIANIIGDEAEYLVYFYASCDRSYFYPRLRKEIKPSFKDRFTEAIYDPDIHILKAFCELTIANELDVALPNLKEYIEKYGRYVLPLFASNNFLSLISESAKNEINQYLLSWLDSA